MLARTGFVGWLSFELGVGLCLFERGALTLSELVIIVQVEYYGANGVLCVCVHISGIFGDGREQCV